ncbi:MAG: pimeloyl-[acyl-carrier protein] methyl ester esterase [Gammaproteobacteria bacterium]|nr:MAG: pimeloyl-[acyl-carrier protein] methyl ester esterase [Gammaproteobacteria bacterium]
MHIRVIGQGPDLVMLHGWSMHSAVWHDLTNELAKNFTLHLVDLPGHGQSSWQQGDLELGVLVNNLAMELPETAYWLGWSLGGLISLAFVELFPERVRKLILMAATPCFVQKDDWSCAMNTDIFKQFADNLNVNQAETLQRFLLLQARGSDHSRDTIRQLGKQLAIENPPRSEALQAGLKLLIKTDMRTQFSDLACPVQMIVGDRDTLIPKDMLSEAKRLHAEVKVSLLSGAGHAPFISQPVECQKLIESFINE